MSTQQELLRAIQEAFKARDNQMVLFQAEIKKEILQLKTEIIRLRAQSEMPIAEEITEETPPQQSLLSRIENRSKIWSGK